MKRKFSIAAAMIAGMLMLFPLAGRAMDMTKPAKTSYTKSELDLRNAMRQLWEDHIIYTRGFIVSSLGDLPDAGPAAERLLRNQDDIGNAIIPFYGEEAGKKLAALLRDHILIAADIVKAAKAGDNAGVAEGQKRWNKNADDIAVFLSGANPKNWPLQDLKNMLYVHLALTTTEVVSRIQKDWAADIAAYDKGHAHMLMFADMLSEGIVKQFPAKFRQ
ncbi:MAG: hypothetical protein M0042_01690 [Nitrospiraceae bacterium]|nr:hypothetical protein [Nitrospiraceae bacterium]